MASIGDGLAMVGAVLRTGAVLVRDRASGVLASQPLPRRVEELTPEALTQILRENHPGVEVVEVEHLGGHAGTTVRSRVRVRFAGSDGGLPEVMFAKLAPRDLPTAIFTVAMGLGTNEVRFYRDLATHVPAIVPRVFAARSSPRGERFLMLFEDLERCGATFRTIHQTCDDAEVEAVLAAMARLHASHWDDPRFAAGGELAWLPSWGSDSAYPVARVMCEWAHGPALKRCGDLVPERFRDRIRMLYRKREALEMAWARGPLTLVHGDPHLGNLYFTRDGEVGFLDWQLARCAQGMRDVTHFITSSLPAQQRRRRERSWIAHYVEALHEAGVEGFDVAAATEQFRLHTLYEWFAASVTIVGALQASELARDAVARAVAAIEDWDALDALAEL